MGFRNYFHLLETIVPNCLFCRITLSSISAKPFLSEEVQLQIFIFPVFSPTQLPILLMFHQSSDGNIETLKYTRLCVSICMLIVWTYSTN